jgi:dipeptidyl aminopeptidase/acylaminoacyl peptidase
MLVGVVVLAGLTVGLAWLLGPQGALPAQQVSPVQTPAPGLTETPTPIELTAPYIGVTASSKDWPTLTPPPPLPPAASPTPRIMPTPPEPSTDIPTYDPRIPLRAENIELVAVQSLDVEQPITFKAWSPTGERFLFGRFNQRYILVQFENGAAANAFWDDLWVANTDGSQLHKLTDLANDWAWSPDGHYIVYLTPAKGQGIDGKLYVVDVERLKPREIADCDLGGMDDLAWLPNTDEITCRRDGVMYAIKSDGSQMRRLNSIFTSDSITDTLTGELLPPVFQGHYRISPDGERVVYLKRSSPLLWISKLDGTSAVEVRVGGSPYISHDIAWSPDSSQLAFSAPNGRGSGLGTDLWVVEADGTGLHRVATPECDDVQFMSPAWSPDGEVIAFTHRVYSDSEHESVWVVNEDGTSAHLLVDVAFAPKWSAKGNAIGVLRERVIARLESLLVFVDLGQ